MDNIFIENCEKELNRILELFKTKNKSYGHSEDMFYNFRQTVIRLFGSDSADNMFMVAEVLKDKHNVALGKGINVPECSERLRDNIVYSLIQLEMLKRKSCIKTK